MKLLILSLLALFSVTLAFEISESVTVNANISAVHFRSVSVFHSDYSFGIFAVAENKYPGFVDFDSYRFGVSLNGYPTVVSAWDMASLNAITLNDSSITNIVDAYHAFAARFIALVEYEESNGIPGFQLNDTILSTYSLKNVDWNPIVYTTINASANATVYVATISTVDGVFTLRFFYAGHGALVDGHLLDGNNFKHSHHINYYNYSGASSSNTSKIGLVTLHACVNDHLNETVNRSATMAGVDHINSAIGVRGYYDWERTINETSSSAETTRTVTTEFEFTYSNPLVYLDWTGDIVLRVTLHTLGLESNRPLNLVWDPVEGQDVNYNVVGSTQPGTTPTSSTPTSNPMANTPTAGTPMANTPTASSPMASDASKLSAVVALIFAAILAM